MTNLTSKDLRIGNKVYSSQVIMRDEPPPSPFTVSSISTSGIAGHFVQFEETGQHPIAIESLYGIPLTPSILEAAGFKNVQTDIYRKKINVSGGWVALIDILQIDSTVYCYEKRWCQFHYLHQIQNLYYSLIKEELTINLNQLQQA